MNKIAYTVICTIQDKAKAQEWLDWLKNTHIDDVITSGASSSKIVMLDKNSDNKNATTYEIQYQFDNRRTFEEYIKHHALRLRNEGLTLFPPEGGFEYKRTIGEIIS